MSDKGSLIKKQEGRLSSVFAFGEKAIVAIGLYMELVIAER